MLSGIGAAETAVGVWATGGVTEYFLGPAVGAGAWPSQVGESACRRDLAAGRTSPSGSLARRPTSITGQ